MTLSEFLKLTSQQKETGVFIQGDRNNGIFYRWYSNGQIMEKCMYVNRKRHGEYISYWDNGQIKEHSFWKNGVKKYDIK